VWNRQWLRANYKGTTLNFPAKISYSKVYNRLAMKITLTGVAVILVSLAGCNKSSAPSSSAMPSVSKPHDAVQQKLAEYAGSSASDCGRLDVRANESQTKSAGDCAMQASQGKKPFYVAYDMPGMSVGVAGNAEGKLFTVQAQGGSVSGGACPSQLRVASSGRVTCFAPGDMSSMSGSHASGSVPSGAANPHAGGNKPPNDK
jgi:hypothetical protein